VSDFTDLAANLKRMSEENNERRFSHDDMQDYWYDLSEREREKAFYCVVSILNSSRKEKLSLRETLYEMFEFNPSMFNIADQAGMTELHSSYQSTKKDTQYVKRVELIDNTGRAYVNMNVTECDIQLQDTGNTLKVFVSTEEEGTE